MGDAKREALALLKNAQPPTPRPAPAFRVQETLRVDVELGRLFIGLRQAAALRLWVIGRDHTRDHGGAGWLGRKTLKVRLKALGITYTRQHFNRLLKGGEGIFWNVSYNRVYLRWPGHVALALLAQAQQESPDLAATNLPGVRDMYVNPAGGLEEWEAALYGGWLMHREDPTIARETLSMLFGRTEETLRHWEQTYLPHQLTIIPNYAQCVNPYKGPKVAKLRQRAAWLRERRHAGTDQRSNKQ